MQVPVPDGEVPVAKAQLGTAYHNLGGTFAMSSLPYMSKLESITSSAVRAAEKVGTPLSPHVLRGGPPLLGVPRHPCWVCHGTFAGHAMAPSLNMPSFDALCFAFMGLPWPVIRNAQFHWARPGKPIPLGVS